MRSRTGTTTPKEEAEYDALNKMKWKDDDFKQSLHDNSDFKQIYLSVYKYQSHVKDHMDDESTATMVQEIEKGLEHRVVFAVRQRRFVTKLHTTGSLAYSDSTWEEATEELEAVSRIIVWRWDSKEMV